MKLIVGLGNPGEEYSLTRHNVGFMAVREIAALNDIKLKLNRRFKAITGEGVIKGENCYLAMPQTFMNLSGHSVRQIVKWLKLDLSELLVILDDIALALGTIRIKAKGSDAGHKGMRSLIGCLGVSDFSRLRVGILGRKNIGDCSRYVLNRFSRKEQKMLPEILNRASEASACWIKEGVERAMNKYNGG